MEGKERTQPGTTMYEISGRRGRSDTGRELGKTREF